MQRNNTYDIAKCWAIVSVIVYHVINIIFYNQIIHSFIDTYFLALFFFISGLLVKDDKVKCKGWLKMKAVQLLIPFFITTAVKSNKITAFLFLGIKAK